MQRHQHRRNAIAQAAVDHFGDAAMVGLEHLPLPRRDGLLGNAFVAGDHRHLADARDRAWRAGWPVAVDHQPRIALRDQVSVELFRQRIGHAGDADIPGDVPGELGFRQPEVAEPARQHPAVMIAGQKERRAAGGIILVNRRCVLASEQQ
jgi:hypothetical protein